MDQKELIKHYQNLLISQYSDKPKARATIGILATMISQVMKTAEEIRDGFNINTAIGNQLDTIGEYVGITRAYQTGNLLDDDYRFVLKLATSTIASNLSDNDVDESLKNFFGDDVFVISPDNMTATFFVKDTSTQNKLLIALNKKAFKKPIGVSINNIIQKPTNLKFFGFKNSSGQYNDQLIRGFGTGSMEDGRMLSINDIVNV